MMFTEWLTGKQWRSEDTVQTSLLACSNFILNVLLNENQCEESKLKCLKKTAI